MNSSDVTCPKCSAEMVRAWRYEISRPDRIDVLWCRDRCNYETPPLYWRAGRKWPGTDDDNDLHERPALSAAAVQGPIRRVG